MRCTEALIKENTYLTKDILRMVLETDIAAEVQCGQFVQVQVPGYFLRRPISVCRVKGNTIVLVYKTVGDGTAAMAAMKPGDKLDLLGPLGNGFPVLDRDVMLVGGGVGVPPLLETAFRCRQKGYSVSCVLGFNSEADIILKEEFEELGCSVYIATMDGSRGTKGTVIDAIGANGLEPACVLACGPLPMLKAAAAIARDGYISLESRMACGFGACMGCVVKTPEGGSLRVCRDGPVFRIGEVAL